MLTQLIGRPVVDRTGLTGLYDFDLMIEVQTLVRLPELGGSVPPLTPGLPEAPSLMTQLQEDLGLRLDRSAVQARCSSSTVLNSQLRISRR